MVVSEECAGLVLDVFMKLAGGIEHESKLV